MANKNTKTPTGADEALIEGLVDAAAEAASSENTGKKVVTREWSEADEASQNILVGFIESQIKELDPEIQKFIIAFVETTPSYWKGVTVGDYRSRMTPIKGSNKWPEVIKYLNDLKKFNLALSTGLTKFNNFVAYSTPRGENVRVKKIETIEVSINKTSYLVGKEVFVELQAQFAGDPAGLKAAVLAVATPKEVAFVLD
jgi:hypothetical protein